jgi:uncharacterized membrane protein
MDSVSLEQHRKRWLPVRYIRARPRLFLCAALGLAVGVSLPQTWQLHTRLLVAWDVGTLAFLVSIGTMMSRASHLTIKRNAALQDEGQFLILTLASLAAVASIGAIVAQLGGVKDSVGIVKALHLGLAGVTIISAWSFMHVMFALHYAHEYFDEWRDHPEKEFQLRGGLDFPGSEDYPDYLDFLYFSFVIGVASATADINIAARSIRRVALVHCVLAFFFNMAILGLTINIAAGLI